MDSKTMRQFVDAWQPQMLSIFRIMVGLLYAQHGLQKWFAIPLANPNFANLQLFSMLGIAGVIEIVCGLLVAAGLFTRVAALLVAGEMAVAYFIYANRLARHFMPIANGGTMEALYCFAFLYLVFAGAGPWSVDVGLRKKA